MSRIARFLKDGTVHYGQVEGENHVQRIEGDIFASWHLTGETIVLNQVKLLAPVSPPNVIAIGLNYRAHAQESNMSLPERPVIFLKLTTAVCGPEDDIVLPQMAPH